MNKKRMICGLVPALAISMSSTVGAQPVVMDANPAMEQNAVTENQTGAGAQQPVTQESLQVMRKQLEEQLHQAQELQSRLNAQLESLDKRMKKVEKRSWQPPVEIHGYGRLRWDKHHYEDRNDPNDYKTIWLNLFTKYRINDRWSLHSEHEFENNLTDNHGAYEGHGGYNEPGGKKYSRPVLQLYAEGRVGEVNVKAGRYYLQSPYKFTFDDKIDGWQASYGIPTKWGRKANFTLSAGNTYSKIFYGDKENELNYWNEGGDGNLKVVSLIGEIPIAKNTNLATHYGKIKRRTDRLERKTWSFGFDTKLNRDLKFWAAMAKSDSQTLNKSHVLQLQYKEARPDIPGSYDIYIKKYLQRGHSGMTNWFNDDIAEFTHGDYKAENLANNDGDKVWQYSRWGEFNGLRVGVDFVPVRNTKLLINYTFGKMGKCLDRDPGRRYAYSFFRTQWEMYF